MSSGIPYPPSIDLARLPTPLAPLERLSQQHGVKILCKRDDLTGAPLSGNKVRKLELLFAAARAAGADRVLTCGGEQSNHARATALAAAEVGLGCHLLLRTAEPAYPPRIVAGNLLLDRLAGAKIEWISPAAYAARETLLPEVATRIEREEGACRVYVIPEGGSNALGAWGYVRCAEELGEQLGRRPATIVYAVGSGGTAAGLIAGCRLLGLPYRLVGVCVCEDGPYFQRRIASILAEMSEQYRVDVAVAAEEIEIWDGYVGLGYAISRDEELCCIRELARLEGLITDPVYTGKAIYGLLSELKSGVRLPEPIVFLHTGGIFGLFAKGDQLEPLL